MLDLLNRCLWNVDLSTGPDDYDVEEVRVQVRVVDRVNLVSSHILNSEGKPSHVHAPVLDLDRVYTPDDAEVLDSLFGEWVGDDWGYDGKPSDHVVVVPSSTEGHCHLYLQFQVPERAYLERLMHLAVLGMIEPGYAVVSIKRAGTFVRLPHVKKGDIVTPPPTNEPKGF